MEERRFDDLTRVLGRARSRRQVVKGQQDVCGDTCCEPGTGCTLVANAADDAVGNAQTCCPVNDENPVPGIAKPGGECCPPGEEAFNLLLGYCPNNPSIDEWVCCPFTAV